MSATSPRMQIVTFRLGDDLFAADIFAIERVLRHTPPTPIPNVPAWIVGVMNYQERVVPVIDLRQRFELPPASVANETRVLVFTGDDWIAAIVDAVLDVTTIDASSLQPPPPLFRGLAGEYLRGLVTRDDRLVVVLDVAALLSTTERLVLDQVTQAAGAAG